MPFSEPNQKVYWLLCDENNKCYCDWRLNLDNCVLKGQIRAILIAGSVFLILTGFTALGILYHRIRYKNQKLWERDIASGLFIPRPVDSLLLMTVLHNFTRAIQSIIILTDVAPNLIFRSFIHELPWQFGVSAFSCYFFGIAHTIESNSDKLDSQWINIPHYVDVLCTIMFFMPFITNNICSILSGIFADSLDLERAYIFTRALHFIWGIYCITVVFTLFFSGVRLIGILKVHRKFRVANNGDVESIDNGILKVKIIIIGGMAALFLFTILSFLYGGLRNQIMMNEGATIVICVFWTFNAPITLCVCKIAVVLTPRLSITLGFIEQTQLSDVYYSGNTNPDNKKSIHSPSPTENIQIPKSTLSKNSQSLQRTSMPAPYLSAVDVSDTSDYLSQSPDKSSISGLIKSESVTTNPTESHFEYQKKLSLELVVDYRNYVTALGAPRFHSRDNHKDPLENTDNEESRQNRIHDNEHSQSKSHTSSMKK
ncbi:hypothetical protein CLU79DRAFT_740773 [Phycomyces nitens]|nr:hypothetical protein CLU79DRAFT_740773 [Phycomyces nitens]